MAALPSAAAGSPDTASNMAPGPRLSVSEGLPELPGYHRLGTVLRGGQGIVFRALQESTGRDVAVKVLRQGTFADAHERARFEREVRVLARLHHPNIVTIHDSGHHDGHAYFVMDYVDGPTLDQFVRRNAERLSPRASSGDPAGGDVAPPVDAAQRREDDSGPNRRARLFSTIELLIKVCQAVHAAHLRGVIHRDLKPSNIRVKADGEPMILDFGLAKFESPEARQETEITQSGQFLGSLPWASPETIGGQPDRADVRSDVYALGVITYQTLTGRFPYDVSGPWRAVCERIEHEDPIRPSRLARDLHAELDSIVLKCLSKDPDRRYQSAGDLALDLRRHLMGEPVQARADSAWYVLRKSLHRHRLPVGFAVVLLFVLVSALVVTIQLYVKEQWAHQTATLKSQEAARARDTANRVKDLLGEIFAGVDRRENPGPPLTLRQVVDRGAEQVLSRLEHEPEVRAELLGMLSRVYRSLGAYEKALELGQESCTLRRESLKAPDEALAACLENLGETLKALERHDEAMTAFQEVLVLRQTLYGDRHPRVSQSVASIAMILGEKGDLSGAEEQYRRAVEIHDLLGDTQSLDRAFLLAEFAGLLATKHQAPAALQMCEEALSGMRAHLPAQHPRIANTLNTLGGILNDVGRLEDAERVLRESIQMRRALVGDDDPVLAYSLSTLARTLGDMGRYTEAVELGRDVLRRRIALIGEEKLMTVMDMSNLALNLSKTGELQEAGLLTQRALEIQRKLLPPGHPAIANRLNILGGILQDQGRYDEALVLYQEALDIRMSAFGEESLEVAVVLNNLGTLRERMEEHDSALDLLNRSVWLRRRHRPVGHIDIGRGLLNLATTQASLGMDIEACASLEEADSIFRAALPTDHPNRAQARHRQGRLLDRLGELDAAERCLCEALAIWEHRGDDAQARIVEADLAEVLADRGAGEEAECLAQEVLDKCQAAPLKDEVAVAAGLLTLGRVLSKLGRPDEAEPYLREAEATFEALMQPQSSKLAEARVALAECLVQLDRGQEARTLLETARLAVEQRFGPEHPRMREINRMLRESGAMQAQPPAS
ncbi:MAG: serine/threonine protein kinase [Phycisphaerales bacterium]|nr:serine/threonine protein kinase [Phycisphaerales bacterium]